MQTIDLTFDGTGVATLTLNRPAKHNAMSAAMFAELAEAAERIEANEDVHAVVLTGAGRSFCAGADLGWMEMQFQASRADRMEQAMALANMLDRLNRLSKPLIGKINGAAYGGGLGLIAVCDVAIATDTARFAFSETRLGIIPATISPYVMARMGEARARRVFFSARLFDAAEAVKLDLLAGCVAPDQLDAAIAAEIQPYLATDPVAVASAKQLTRSLGPVIDAATIRQTAEALADAWDSPQAQKRIGAFLLKTKG
ncbi:crotonase/enoyl-CoA hydratase family protein [Aureimonas fodinaquatilis]|uniref:Crotonase/enoyl-CoA hydratase family protein n=1 Tax=Aureimonas fodinaquatilis TaxID=2565783 RepID=A0A5B0DRI1_9HYPH|nr:crotonase/enoyl-CoA hydratase family protein [Aureimonas fodinaquatilis]KAA0969407.1 crotonase/enoyl-CoA hydratase family protein [Aureimonas fodinaquatilis]